MAGGFQGFCTRERWPVPIPRSPTTGGGVSTESQRRDPRADDLWEPGPGENVAGSWLRAQHRLSSELNQLEQPRTQVCPLENARCRPRPSLTAELLVKEEVSEEEWTPLSEARAGREDSVCPGPGGRHQDDQPAAC